MKNSMLRAIILEGIISVFPPAPIIISNYFEFVVEQFFNCSLKVNDC
jgi:hypothetical protein